MTAPALTAKDRADVPRTRELAADLVAQSFVRNAEDIKTLRELLGRDGPSIVAKIETKPAVEHIEKILRVTDVIMVARGDLGVETSVELVPEVPLIQKQLVRRALDRGVPSIVATQMLESMITSPRPTRAEASDVANAVFDGADAIMLSGETAIGAYPILAAEAAARICLLCEQRGSEHLAQGAPPASDTDARALAYAAVTLSAAENAIAGIACYTRTGSTARILASLRPRVPIFAFSPDPAVLTRLALVHGVVARTCVAATGTADRLGLMAWLLGESKSMPAGAAVVLVASTAAAGSGPNLLEVHRIPA